MTAEMVLGAGDGNWRLSHDAASDPGSLGAGSSPSQRKPGNGVLNGLRDPVSYVEPAGATDLAPTSFISHQGDSEHFRFLVEAAKNYAIFGLDLEGRVTSWNPGAERIKGWKTDEILGQHFRVLFLPEHRNEGRPEHEMKYALETGPYLGEEIRLRKDGSTFEAEVALHAIRDPAGRPRGFVKITEDITERKRAERESEAVRRFLQDLVAVLGHDLRNPFNAISLSAGMIQTRSADSNVQRLATRIHDASSRGARIVGDLLDLSQAQLLGTIPLSRAAYDLALLSRQVVDEYQASHPDREIALSHQGDTSGFWDGHRLMQVLANLLANAIRHGASDRPIHVDISPGAQGFVTASVHNRGPVIPSELVPELFKPYRKGTRPDTNEKGLGVGLHIVDKIVSAHGGSVAVESSAAGGTRFVVTLPRGSPQPASTTDGVMAPTAFERRKGP